MLFVLVDYDGLVVLLSTAAIPSDIKSHEPYIYISFQILFRYVELLDPGFAEDALHVLIPVVVPVDASLGLQPELIFPGGGQVPHLKISDLDK